MRISDWSSDVCSSDLTSIVRCMMYEITAGPRLSLRSSLRMFVKSNAVIRDPRSRLSVGAQKTWPFWFSLIQGRMAVRALDSAGSAVLQLFIRLDRKSVVSGKSVYVRVDLGDRGRMKKKR